MNKAILLLFLVSLSFFSNAQTFGEIGTVWKNYDERHYPSGSPGQGYVFSSTNMRYEYIQDSIVGLDTFQLFSRCGIRHTHTTGDYTSIDEWDNSFFVYQDSGKVFYGDTGSFRLAYDFNLVMGDSFLLHQFPFWNDSTYSFVTSVDSVLMNGVLRKRIEFNPIISYTLRMVWIEGVGDSIFGLFQWPSTIVYTDNCFIQNDSTIFGPCSPDYQCPELYEPPIGPPFPINGVVAFPNPFEEEITLYYEGADTVYSMLIFNLQGQKVHEEFIYENQHVLNLEHLIAGTYIVHISDAKRAFTVKIVKL